MVGNQVGFVDGTLSSTHFHNALTALKRGQDVVPRAAYRCK
jgi:hypothetical protein